MGFPVNSPDDNLVFSLSANGEKGYFTLKGNNEQGSTDIYQIAVSKNIPLTLVKGLIRIDNFAGPINAKISVIDKTTNQPLDYIFDPNPTTGRYLLIFPPNRSYRILVEANGYLPHQIDIDVPKQSYFYELFQEIRLKAISTLGVVVGEEVEVKNSFYDVAKVAGQKDKDYDPLIQMVEKIVNSSNSISTNEVSNISKPEKTQAKKKNYDDLISLVDKAIESTDTATLNYIQSQTAVDESKSNVFFYPSGNKNAFLEKVAVGNDSVYAIPAFGCKSKEDDKISASSKTEKKELLTTQVFFESGSFQISEKFKTNLDGLAQFTIGNKNIGVDVIGYTDDIGEEQSNLELSKNRAQAVLNYLLEKGCSLKKITLIGMGNKTLANDEKTKDGSYMRRVDLKIFEIVD